MSKSDSIMKCGVRGVLLIVGIILLMTTIMRAQPAKIKALEGFSDVWSPDTMIYNGDARRVTYISESDTLWGYYGVDDSLTTYRAQIGDTLWIDTIIWGLHGYSREDLRLAQTIENLPDRDNSRWPDLVERLRHLRMMQRYYEQ